MPASTHCKPQHVAKERTVRVRVLAIQHYVRAITMGFRFLASPILRRQSGLPQIAIPSRTNSRQCGETCVPSLVFRIRRPLAIASVFGSADLLKNLATRQNPRQCRTLALRGYFCSLPIAPGGGFVRFSALCSRRRASARVHLPRHSSRLLLRTHLRRRHGLRGPARRTHGRRLHPHRRSLHQHSARLRPRLHPREQHRPDHRQRRPVHRLGRHLHPPRARFSRLRSRGTPASSCWPSSADGSASSS